ncbi:FAD-dependent oxidoreductase [Nesterenkonia rhizosphaerae]|uniref:FAD-binding oxidoreductase n=1 Tax=Nesterenkonia rhizosphaerae TaxID=1348272 RepID=A0ABP9FVV2_9MICC
MSAVPRTGADVLVIGAGAVGSAVAFYCARAGMSVTVLDKGKPGGATSSSCEGNLLVSDKEHGPELDLANYSLDLWRGELEEFGHLWEFENKGGIIVASRESSMTSLQRALRTQREHGIRVEEIDVPQLRELEPNISDDAVGAAFYPDDAQLMPMLLTAHMLRLARSHGAQVHPDTEVTGFLSQGERITGVTTNRGEFQADVVINAAGPWSGQLASLAGVTVPVEPRRGYVLVTEPLPPKVFHKVYAAEYIDNVGSSDDGLQTSPVVEGTPAGSILIGSSRERVGFDPTFSPTAVRDIARNAVELFPFLSDVRILRHYFGFRPYSPDHVPVIGPDPRAPGLWHACGHEGAGIGLASGTGKLIAQAVAGEPTDLDLAAFAPDRFGAADSEAAQSVAAKEAAA